MSEPTTYREAVLMVFIARLQAIAVSGGFRTDVGQTLFVGHTPDLGPDDPSEAAALIVGVDRIRAIGEHVTVLLPIEIAAVARGGADADTWLRVERVLGDIKQAIELEDRRLDGLLRERIERGETQTLLREGGSTSSGVSITYLVPMSEQWGHP